MSDSSAQSPDNVDSKVVHRGGCFCGLASYQVNGLPLLSAFCHCSLCQRLNAAAFINTCHFPASRFVWTHTGPIHEVLDSYLVASKPWKIRWRCKKCGCTIASHNTKLDEWSVWGAQFERDEGGKIIDWETVKPTAHIYYDTRLVDIQDSLSKWAGYEDASERLA